jgi:pimeloyl-ACP methyl ester carboxylesterase
MCFFLNEQQEHTYRAIMKLTYLMMRLRHPWLSALPGMTNMMAMRYFHRIPDDEALLKQGLSDYMTLDLETAVASAENATDETIPAAGERIQAPTLLIACRQDQVMPVDNVDFTVASIPGCELRWIEECGHLPMIEKPLEYLNILESFLDLEQ